MAMISLLIKDDPAATHAALRFARAVALAGTQVDRVFFYGRGVLHARGASKQFWSSWSRKSGARLILCSASADAFEMKAGDAFCVEGLGELIEAGLNSHKVVSFG